MAYKVRCNSVRKARLLGGSAYLFSYVDHGRHFRASQLMLQIPHPKPKISRLRWEKTNAKTTENVGTRAGAAWTKEKGRERNVSRVPK